MNFVDLFGLKSGGSDCSEYESSTKYWVYAGFSGIITLAGMIPTIASPIYLMGGIFCDILSYMMLVKHYENMPKTVNARAGLG